MKRKGIDLEILVRIFLCDINEFYLSLGGQLVHCYLLLLCCRFSWSRLLGKRIVGNMKDWTLLPNREGESEEPSAGPRTRGESLMLWGRISFEVRGMLVTDMKRNQWVTHTGVV